MSFMLNSPSRSDIFVCIAYKRQKERHPDSLIRVCFNSTKETRMRPPLLLLTAATLTFAAAHVEAGECRLTPKEVATRFITEFYIEKRVREAFETWVEPGYIQHNPLAATRSEEHTSELQSPDHLVCRLLLEKKKN